MVFGKKRAEPQPQIEEPVEEPVDVTPVETITISPNDVERENRRRSLQVARQRSIEEVQRTKAVAPLDEFLLSCDRLDNPSSLALKLLGKMPNTSSTGAEYRLLDVLRIVAAIAVGITKTEILRTLASVRKQATRYDLYDAAVGWIADHPNGYAKIEAEVGKLVGEE